MGNNKPESYFKDFKYNNKEFGIIDCYDGHSVSADSLTQMSKLKFTFFYDVEDGCFSENYIICSHIQLSNPEIKQIDEFLAEKNN